MLAINCTTFKTDFCRNLSESDKKREKLWKTRKSRLSF